MVFNTVIMLVWACCSSDFAGRISIVSASPAGACRLGPEDDCFTDGAGNYGARESCTIRINVAGTLTATQFDTEPNYDTITIGGTEYNGDTGPLLVAVAAGTSVAWRTDGSVTGDGWTICLTPDGTTCWMPRLALQLLTPLITRTFSVC